MRPSFAAGLVIAAHSLDAITFWMAVGFAGIPIANEQNPLMVAAYNAGGFEMVVITKIALTALLLALMARVRTKPMWLPFALAYGLGLVGATANLIALHAYLGG